MSHIIGASDPKIHFLHQARLWLLIALNGGINQPTFRHYCLLKGVLAASLQGWFKAVVGVIRELMTG